MFWSDFFFFWKTKQSLLRSFFILAGFLLKIKKWGDLKTFFHQIIWHILQHLSFIKNGIILPNNASQQNNLIQTKLTEVKIKVVLTSWCPVRCVSPHSHESATRSPAPWSNSGANQGTGWFLRVRSAPLHTELWSKNPLRELSINKSKGGYWRTRVHWTSLEKGMRLILFKKPQSADTPSFTF